jgi:hypothetical protein
VKAVLGVVEPVNTTSSVRLHTQALDEKCQRVWREGPPTVDDVLEVLLESCCACVHPDTDTRCRDTRIADTDVVVGDSQGRSESVAGPDAPEPSEVLSASEWYTLTASFRTRGM